MKTRWLVGLGLVAAVTFVAGTNLTSGCPFAVLGTRLAGANTAPSCGLQILQTSANASPGEQAEATDAGEKAEDRLKPQSTCPIMGVPIDASLYFDYEGKRIHVCCPPCVEAVKADPEAALATLAEAGVGPAQARCPIMDRPINAELYVDHEGHRIYVCCAGCVRRVKNDPQAALQTLLDQGIVPEIVGETTEDTAEKDEQAL